LIESKQCYEKHGLHHILDWPAIYLYN